MLEPIRVAVLGASHDHVWSDLPNLTRCPDVQIVAGWDPHLELAEKLVAAVPGLELFSDPDALLTKVQPEAVLICSSNAEDVDLTKLAATRGAHCIVEKPMANTLVGADAMLDAAEAADVRLIINWPICWEPALWHAARLAVSGEFGPLWQVRYRSAHNGPENFDCSSYFIDWLFDEKRNGPGAFTDYTCYGAAVCAWLQGLPSTVTGVAGRYVKTVDIPADNATLLLSYPTAMSIVEASWTQVSAYPRTGAYFHCHDALIEPLGDQIRLSTAANPDGAMFAAEAPPAPLTSLGHYLKAIVRDGLPAMGILDARIARNGQAIMEAGWGSRTDRRGDGATFASTLAAAQLSAG